MRMTVKGQIAIDNILNLATSANSEKVKLDANIFVYEAIYGKATARIQYITEETNKDSNVDIDDMLSELEELEDNNDNVIEQDRKKAK